MEKDKHIGEIKGDFEIISRDLSKNRQYYFLKCIYCGKIEEKSTRYDNFLRERTCFCKKDLTGQIFGYLKVLKYDEKTSKERKNSYYICECLKCNRGKTILARAASLKNGNTKSCGCLNDDSHRKNLENQIFGNFKIINLNYEKTYSEKRLSTGSCWNAQCLNCKKIKILKTRELLQGKIPFCDCEKIYSRGEQKIEKYLSILSFTFEKQKTFSELKSNDNVLLRFDFYLLDLNTIIEYQGKQHYEPIDYFGGEESFKKQLENDNLKRRYCKENNIKLIEIPYWDYDIINEEYLLNLLN